MSTLQNSIYICLKPWFGKGKNINLSDEKYLQKKNPFFANYLQSAKSLQYLPEKNSFILIHVLSNRSKFK